MFSNERNITIIGTPAIMTKWQQHQQVQTLHEKDWHGISLLPPPFSPSSSPCRKHSLAALFKRRGNRQSQWILPLILSQNFFKIAHIFWDLIFLILTDWTFWANLYSISWGKVHSVLLYLNSHRVLDPDFSFIFGTRGRELTFIVDLPLATLHVSPVI